MIAGILEIQMAADLARLASDMGKAKDMVGGAMKGITASVNTVKTALGALGVGLSIEGLRSMVQGTIDAQDKLLNLSKTTQIAVEDLAGLRLAAKQSGTDLETTATAIAKLSANVAKDPERFRKLGITAKEPIEQFKQLADILGKIEDPGQRFAVAGAAISKEWKAVGPLLAEGGKKIGEMIEKGKELSGANKEQAERAAEFNNRMAELQTTLDGVKLKTIGPMIPQFTAIAEAMGLAATESGILMAAWVGLGGIAHTLWLEIRKLAGLPNTELEAVTENIVELQRKLSMKGTFGSRERGEMEAQLVVAKQRLGVLEQEKKLAEEAAKVKPPAKAAQTPEQKAAEAAKIAEFIKQQSAAASAARLSQLEAEANRELEITKDNIAHENQLLDMQHQQNEISDAAYFERKLALAKKEADAELQVLASLLIQQEAALNKTKSGTAEYYKALKDVEETTGKIAKVERELGQTREVSLKQAAIAADQYNRTVEQLNIQLMQLRGETAAAAKAQFEMQNRDFRKKAVARGDEATVKNIDDAAKLTAAQSDFNKEREELSTINARLQLEEERIQNTYRTGSMSELEAMAKTGEARRRSVAQQEAIIENMRQMAVLSENPALMLQAEQAAAALERLRSESDLLGQKINTIFTTEAANAFSDFIEGSKSAKEAFNDFGNAVVKQINRMVTEALAKKLFETMGMGGGATGGGGIGGILGGLLGGFGGGGGGNVTTASAFVSAIGAQGFATGTDFVPRDMLAMVHKGERIVPANENKSSPGTTNNITLNITGVSDAASFRASQTQIVSDMSMALSRAPR